MANLPLQPNWTQGIYQIETLDPVLGGENGISNAQAKQLGGRTEYLKQRQDDLLERVDGLEQTTDQSLLAAMGQQIVANREHTELAFSELNKAARYRHQAGEVRFINRGTRWGCAVSKSTTATRNLSFAAGELFAHGRIYHLPERINGAAVPSNATDKPATCVAFVRITPTAIECDVSATGADAPADAIALYRINVPAGSNSGNDPQLAGITLTDVRRIEPDFPAMLTSPPSVLALWPHAYPQCDDQWGITYCVISAVGAMPADAIAISERASNGARFTLAAAADDVVVRYQLSNHGV
ncbi:MAG: hypothetical protein ACRCYV_03665 [Aeromonas sp.]